MVSVCGYHCGENKEGKVLILISVEDGFCATEDVEEAYKAGLNPYFCGRWFL